MSDCGQIGFEWTAYESPSWAVIATVAAASDRPPRELPPLYDSVDPDTLDALFEDSRLASDADIRITFRFGGYEVTLHQCGEIYLVPTPAPVDEDDTESTDQR